MNKLNLGCGDDILEGWINIDAYNPIAQVKADVSSLPYDDNFADVILASHVIEHFHFHDGFKVINEWKRVLKPDGKLIIETPDLLETCKEFVALPEGEKCNLYGHFFASPWVSGQTHYFLYTETQLKWTLEQCGFKDIIRILPDSTYSRAKYPNMQNIYLRMECKK